MANQVTVVANQVTASCAGFVPFRWLRPRCWHVWQWYDTYAGGEWRCRFCPRIK